MCGEPICSKCGASNWILTDKDGWAVMMCMNCEATIDLELYVELFVA